MQHSEQKRIFGYIEVLRVIAALGVMLSHIGYGMAYTKDFQTTIGVNLFFCASAFLLMYNTEQTSLKTLFIRRLIHLIPLYWILTILTFIASYFVSNFGQANIPLDQLLKSLFFIPYVRDGLKSVDVTRPIVGPAWTMYNDFWFLIIFVLAAKINRKHRGLIACAFCLIIRLCGELLPHNWAVTRFMQYDAWLVYISGICVYYLWTFVQKTILNQKQHLWISLPLGIILLLLLYFLPKPIWGTCLLCVGILFVALHISKTAPVHPLVSWFGVISYSFYLTHYYVVMIVSIFIDFSHPSIANIFGTIVVLAVSLFVAQISHYIFERMIGNFLRKKLLPK